MAEKSFDALLYQALLEAGWQENRTAWEGTEEPAFSPQYLRWRTRLLADPFGWGKKQLRPLWAKALRTAACILLAASVTLGSLMAVRPTPCPPAGASPGCRRAGRSSTCIPTHGNTVGRTERAI